MPSRVQVSVRVLAFDPADYPEAATVYDARKLWLDEASRTRVGRRRRRAVPPPAAQPARAVVQPAPAPVVDDEGTDEPCGCSR
jgi:hypothetical protein